MSELVDALPLLNRIVRELRFAECPHCGNEQPYLPTRANPECEECARPFEVAP